jgi:uncharacterized Zn-finger protein
MNASERLTDTMYEEIKEFLCPYCKAKLPCVMISTSEDAIWEHSIIGTEHRFMCQSASFRNEFAQRTFKAESCLKV